MRSQARVLMNRQSIAALIKNGSVVLFVFLLLFASGRCQVFYSFGGAFLRGITAVIWDKGTQWMIFLCLGIYLVIFIFIRSEAEAALRPKGSGGERGTSIATSQTFWLVGILFIAVIHYAANYSPFSPALPLFFGVTVGQGISLLASRKWNLDCRNILLCLVGLLAFSSWWHLDMSGNYYHGPRWMGLWDDPNTYGILMGVGLVLAAGVLANARPQIALGDWKIGVGRWMMSIFIWLAAGMMLVGLIMSYSRGAWLATAAGLVYLARCYGKLKWRFVLPVAALVVVAVIYLWGSTLDSAPWYVKRADLGRPSAQHRASAWRAGLEIMRDHPLGVGWNNAVKTYQNSYYPPDHGAAAIATNDYMMIGTELGIPALFCFVAYVALCYRRGPHLLGKSKSVKYGALEHASSVLQNPVPLAEKAAKGFTVVPDAGNKRLFLSNTGAVPVILGNPSDVAVHCTLLIQEVEAVRATCLSGALVFLVAFWFDAGLFKLPTAALFWVLLELGYHTKFALFCAMNMAANNNRGTRS